ncbi:MAG: monofunctional biosynthetic peptidoglycan transglycosylase [Pseudomonadales bacterium]
MPSQPAYRRRPARKRGVGLWLRRLLLLAICLVLLSVLLLLPLRWVDPPTTAFMLADDSGGTPLLYRWQPWEQLGTAAALAVVAAEDQRFADHFGLDVDSIRKSLAKAEAGGRLRGASTISQQLVKNLYLWSGRSMLRKGLEAYLTVVLEVCLPKRRILEIYLNIVELGPGVYGFPAAADHFFAKDSHALTFAEAALLAAVLPNPLALRADAPTAYLHQRQQWIFQHMRRLEREQWLLRITPAR